MGEIYPDTEQEDKDLILENEGGMTFLDHLDDLRATLLRSLFVFILMAALILVFLKQFAYLLNWPLQFALGAGNAAQSALITTGPMAVFSVILQVTFIGAFALALPFILYFVARFIAPGLTPRELNVLRPGCSAAFFLFLFGSAFSFFILIPAALRASMFFNEMFGYDILWTADSYYGMLMWMTLGIGFLFEFPLVVVLLVYAGIVNTQQLKDYRSHSVVVFLIIAALVTPTTDPITFLLLSVPMSILYEGALVVGRRIEKNAATKEFEE